MNTKNDSDCRDDCCGADATDLAALVRCYRTHHHALHKMLDAFRELQSLAEAIHFGAGGIDPTDNHNPKNMYSHQHRLGREFCSDVASHLATKERSIAECESFDDLQTFIEHEAPGGFGELAIYDTAIRIGAKQNLFPAFVCLHAGAKIGADNWGLDTSEGKLTITKLPPEFRDLQSPPLDDNLLCLLCVYAEDFLCIYKDELLRLKQKENGL